MFSAYYYDWDTGERNQFGSRTIELTDPIHVFLASWSGSYSLFNVAHFSEVELTVNGIPVELPSAVSDWSLYQ